MSTETATLDPITLEVVPGSLVSTVLQMRDTLVRTAYAPILYETKDFSCGLMTADRLAGYEDTNDAERHPGVQPWELAGPRQVGAQGGQTLVVAQCPGQTHQDRGTAGVSRPAAGVPVR